MKTILLLVLSIFMVASGEASPGYYDLGKEKVQNTCKTKVKNTWWNDWKDECLDLVKYTDFFDLGAAQICSYERSNRNTVNCIEVIRGAIYSRRVLFKARAESDPIARRIWLSGGIAVGMTFSNIRTDLEILLAYLEADKMDAAAERLSNVFDFLMAFGGTLEVIEGDLNKVKIELIRNDRPSAIKQLKAIIKRM